MNGFGDRLEQNGITRVVALALFGAMCLALFWTVSAALMYQWLYDGRIFQGVRLLDADLGAYRPEEARAELLHRYDAYARQTIVLRAGQQEWKATPAQLGLRFDVDRSVQQAYDAGRNGNFLVRLFTQWRYAVQGYPLAEVGLQVDDTVLEGYLKTLAPQIGRAMRDAGLVVQPDLQARITPSNPGVELKVDKTAALIRPVLLGMATTPVELVVQEASPSLTEADLVPAKARADRIIGEPMVLQYEDRTWTLDRQALAAMLTYSKSAGEQPSLDVRLDKAKLEQFLKEVAGDVDQLPLDARFDFSSTGKLKVIRESRDGRQLDISKAVEAIQSQAASPIRNVTLPVNTVAPKVASTDGDGLLPLDFIEAAKTEYKVGSAERIWNIELAAKRLHGVVVPPGETFSFNREVGPTTLDAGFKWGWGIAASGDKFATVPSEAGGICQVATTLFQTVFWAGYPIEERTPHIYWITAYGQPPKGMKGLDATVDQIYDNNGKLNYQVDLKFTNSTDRPVLIQAYADGKKDLTFALYGARPPWKVEVSEPKVEDVVPANPTPVMEIDPKAAIGQRMQIERAQDGFKATVVRKVTQEGQEPRVLSLVSTYKPARNVFLVGPQPTPSPTLVPSPEPTSPPATPTPTPRAPTPAANPTPSPRPAR
ncbi:MAG: VanW family protein [Actinobacteria bacterium]|nr:VanW family protein [Actinomycetota bacterium]